MGPTVNSGLYNAMLQIAKSEKMVDRLQPAAFAGCKTKSFEEFSLFLATFRLLSILLFPCFSELNFYTLCIEILTKKYQNSNKPKRG